MRRLGSKQRSMLQGYMAWQMLILLLLSAATAIHLKISEKSTSWPSQAAACVAQLVGRIFFCTITWAVLLYSVTHAGIPLHRTGSWTPGLTDLVLIVPVVVPTMLLPLCLLLAWSALCWLRDRSVRPALALAAVSLYFATTRENHGHVVALSQLVAVVGLAYVRGRLGFLLSLPVCFFLSVPKWFRDDWSWRAWVGSTFSLRRLLLRAFPILEKPRFDAPLPFEEEAAAVLWPEEEATAIAEVGRGHLWESVSFRFPVLPAIAHPSSSSSDGSSGPSRPAPKDPATAALVGALGRFVERVGGRPPSLTSLDSLQAIRLVELVCKELGRVVSVGDVLKAGDIYSLAQLLQEPSSGQEEPPPAAAPLEGPDAEGAFRVYTQHFPRSPVDWYIRLGGSEHPDLAALQRAVNHLVARHSALQTVETPDEALREANDRAASLWQLFASCYGGHGRDPLWRAISSLVAGALYACWHRTLLRPAKAAAIEIRTPLASKLARSSAWEDLSDEEYFFWLATELRKSHRWPFDVFLIPVWKSGVEISDEAGSRPATDVAMTLPPEAVSWYLYAGITHCYSDGASGQALLGDLLRLYAEERGQPLAPSSPQPLEHFAVLQQRLQRSLHGRPQGHQPDPNGDLYHELCCEDWGKRPGLSSRIYLDDGVFQALQVAATDVLGCGIGVAWLTAILGALFRLFPKEPCFRLILKCACRDGPGESEMVGFLAEQRTFAVDIGDPSRATLLDVAMQVDLTRRARAWRAPVPYEPGLCVYVNIVASMLDGLPLGCCEVAREASAPSGSGWGDAYAHLNLRLDQKTATNWDFRIFHHTWGFNWPGYFAGALGAVIADMAECPTEPLVPPPRPLWRLGRVPEQKRKRQDSEDATSNGSVPKMSRVTSSDNMETTTGGREESFGAT